MHATSISLLERLRERPSDADWTRLVAVYTPLIHGWLRRQAPLTDADADDLTQEVLSALVRELPAFRHSQQVGAFRHWLRGVTVNRLRYFLRSRRGRAAGSGDSEVLQSLHQLEDAESDLSRVWDQEHDAHVAARLLDMIEPEFQPSTWQAFKRTALDGARAPDVAAELGMTVKAVVVAKSRVLKRLRDEARGLLG
jgi:RNA polymerase sigma-70 factor (ECF subfamily)